jgi:hypothetical protein
MSSPVGFYKFLIIEDDIPKKPSNIFGSAGRFVYWDWLMFIYLL